MSYHNQPPCNKPRKVGMVQHQKINLHNATKQTKKEKLYDYINQEKHLIKLNTILWFKVTLRKLGIQIYLFNSITEVGIKGHFLRLVKITHQKPSAKSILNGEALDQSDQIKLLPQILPSL